jgi:hypothetical protein
MPDITQIEKMRLPFGGQEIEFQHLVHEAGGVPFMRIRIRENKRFTIFDVDPVSAKKWAETMLAWAIQNSGHGCSEPKPGPHPNPPPQAGEGANVMPKPIDGDAP